MGSVAGVGIDVIRGALIGTAEVVPGVSGGTIALIVGVYDRLIGSAAAVVRGTVSAIVDVPSGRGTARARGHFSAVSWRVILPVLAGMAVAVLVASALLAPAIDSHPVETRAVFVGLILASLVVPIRMVGRWRSREVLLAVLAAVLAFVLTGLPAAGDAEPQLWFVAVAAAIAICALVLPGVSGSFLLLAMGLYAPTLEAVNDRDLVYLGVFALGAVLGLASFAPLLQWLLERRRQVTLAIMTGLMLGSLRALWPWQTETGGVLAPEGAQLPMVIALVVAGAALVVGLLFVESRLVRRRIATGRDVLAESTAE
nr:DUF368 domain-containing protein [uncultured Schumannella sp.]